MANIKVITPPTLTSVLSLAELRLHCRIDGTDLDGPLAIAMAGAHAHAQHYTQTSIGAQVIELALDEFPAGPIQLPRGPVTGLVSIKYLDLAGAEQTLAGSAYFLDDYPVPAWTAPAVDTTWPDTLATVNAVKVRYSAGVDAVDPAVKSALLLLVAHLVVNPVAVTAGQAVELPFGVQALLDTVRVWSV